MCEIISQAAESALSRRRLLGGGAALAVGATSAAVLGGTASEAAASSPAPAHGRHDSRTQLVLLGTAGGPPWWPGTTREGIGSALVVDDAVYVVDFGDGSGRRFKEAALVPKALQTPGGLWGEENIRGMFVTHLHSDHISDYFHYFMLGWYNGITPKHPPIHVYGPGRRVDDNGNVVMEPIFTPPGVPTPTVPVVNPANPVPGIEDTTGYLYQAFALDLNDRMRDNLKPDLRNIFHVHDIAIPKGIGYHPNDNPSPTGMEPLLVHEDADVRVSATLVNHFPIVPAFGFRFDTADGAVVFSGDTGPNDNLVALAQGADVLVHEVIDPAWVDILFPPPLTPVDESLKHHLLTAHTTIDDVGKIAERAGVKTLVLSHIVPGNASRAHLAQAGRNFSGRLVIGQDLMRIGVGRRRH
jgi:ribonuclease BN (tRNA processing enzyme)